MAGVTRRRGVRGTALQNYRRRMKVGQRHVARALDLSQPNYSNLEREVYGGMPRGRSADALDAIAAILANDGADCWQGGESSRGCGCSFARGE